MRRSPVVRLLIALWAVWLGAAITEPAALSGCPMHGASATQMAAAAHAAASHAGHAGHEHPASDKHSGHHCSCLGSGCCSATAAPPSATVALFRERTVAERSRAVRAERPASRAYPHRLPFANGPPVVG